MTFASAAAALAGITVTGVKRAYAYQPAQISTADMPLMFPALPSGRQSVATFSAQMGLRSARLNLVVVVEPLAQSTPQSKWARGLALMDALLDALVANADALNLDAVALRTESLLIGETDYWGVVADVEVSE